MVSSYDLFVLMVGLECAMFPVLYPTTDFTDTGIREHYAHLHNDDTNRVISVGLSYTRKVLSSVRVYAEQRDLTFFLYERYLANKFFTAQTRAQRMGVTGDIGVSLLLGNRYFSSSLPPRFFLLRSVICSITLHLPYLRKLYNCLHMFPRCAVPAAGGTWVGLG